MYKNLENIVATLQTKHLNATAGGPIPVYTIDKGLSKNLPGHEIEISIQSSGDIAFKQRWIGDPVSHPRLTWPVLRQILNKIMLSYFCADYKTIKKHEVFRHFFHYSERQILFMHQGKEVTRTLGSFPCIHCGIILPEDQITIDHHYPQTGGEMLALLKVLRACHLTQEGPSGELGKFYAGQSAHSPEHLAAAIMAPPSWPTAHYPFPQRAPKNKPDLGTTLNDFGTLIYSVLVWSGDIRQVMQNCMNSFLNLKPSCLRCNASKGNSI
ncbi:hypothetical protein [Acidovorax sp. SUPP2825]|uniref:hypothetical protein n=1 Tax=Acidovorax sp. SUPP2825 TaxID=2920879 RepID=UPI0023DE5731|nr:hypothetical protein [Acidovorax sp. SUPP2825]GKS97522.1 hypothetical protein AVAK2825_23325 [Acidovorax sp. SUPP2825]